MADRVTKRIVRWFGDLGPRVQTAITMATFVPTDEQRALADFIADGGDLEFIEQVERAYGVES